jgi:outer membrane protein assembly factor BamB
MVIGFKSDVKPDVDIEMETYLDNLRYYCYGVDGFDSAKYEVLKEQMLNDYSDDEIDVVEDVVQPLVPVSSVSSGPMVSPWPMMCYDTHHTGRSPYSTAHVNGLEKWRFRCGGGVDGGIVIDNDGIIYFGDKGRKINALYPNGTLKWRYAMEHWVTSAPALAEDGTLYVGSWDCYLYAFNSTTGKLKWKLHLGKTIGSSPAIGEDGTIYTATANGRVWAVNPNGTKKWYYSTGGGNIWGDSAIGDDGTIYVGTWKGDFFAINPNGTLKWSFKKGGIMKGPPSIADDGTVYIGSFDGDNNLHALYPNNGSVKWKCDVGYGTETNPSIADDGTIYVGSYKELYAVYPDGSIRWTFDIGEYTVISWSCPAISADGTIYVGTQIDSTKGGDILAINPDGTEKWRKRICNEWIRSSPCIGEDGTVYIGSQDDAGYLHAFGPVESNNPPNIPTISGETNGNVRQEYWYTFRAIDPDNNPISWYIEWGDGSHTGWTTERASNENCYYEHTWLIRKDYTIRAKARDVLGEESDWAYLEVTMPKNQQVSSMWFLEWMSRHPILQKILDVISLV